MVHNGIEYAMMQAYAEGWELLEKVDSVTDVREVFRSWQDGTVIRSWLLDLAVNALDEDEHLEKLRGYAEDSGEGRWTVEAAIDNAVPLPAITASLFARFASRQDDSPQMKMIAALRNQFGGHAVESAKKATRRRHVDDEARLGRLRCVGAWVRARSVVAGRAVPRAPSGARVADVLQGSRAVVKVSLWVVSQVRTRSQRVQLPRSARTRR